MIPHPFHALEGEYLQILATSRVTREREVNEVADRLLKHLDLYGAVAAKTGVPSIWLAAIGEREGGEGIFREYFGNGDSLLRPTRDVPRNRGPFVKADGSPDWVAGTLDAIALDHVDRVPDPPGAWTWSWACYKGEAWNGFGPRNHGRVSGYICAGLAVYDDGPGGKYVADGRWDAGARDAQLGIIPLMMRMAVLDPALQLPGWPTGVAPPLAAPAPVPEGHRAADAVQVALNRILNAGLDVDGSYGRATARAVRAFQERYGLDVDGVAGPATWAKIDEVMRTEPAPG